MNPTLEIIEHRRSLRAYADRSIGLEEKQAILNAAFRAPTAGNLMLYSIIEIEDQAMKDRLAETCDHQPFIARAPWVLLFLADYQRWFDYYTFSGVEQRCKKLDRPYRKPAEGDLMLACSDALIAAQTAVIAAESLGIGSCYIGDVTENYEIHQEMFHLPQYVFPIAMLCFGYPRDGGLAHRPTLRFYKDYVLHKNGYRRLEPDELEQMMAPVQKLNFPNGEFPNGAENIGQYQYFRKTGADFSFEMTRSVRLFLKRWAG